MLLRFENKIYIKAVTYSVTVIKNFYLNIFFNLVFHIRQFQCNKSIYNFPIMKLFMITFILKNILFYLKSMIDTATVFLMKNDNLPGTLLSLDHGNLELYYSFFVEYLDEMSISGMFFNS